MNKDLTVGTPRVVLLKFCLPLFASVIFQQLYNIADSWVAGRFIGEDALAAVGNSYEITLIYIAFAFGCNMGCSVVSAHYFGAHNFSRMKTCVYTASIFTLILSLVLTVLGLVLAPALLEVISTPAEIWDASLLYLRIYTLGLTFVFLYNLSTGVFTALGDSVTPFVFLAVSSLSNIGVDILFVKVFDMGVAGVAWATFICQSAACVLAVAVVFFRLKSIKVSERVAVWNWHIFRRIIVIAVPSMLQQSFISVGNMFIQSIINGFGPAVIAGYSAAVKLNNMVITAFTTFANGVSNYTSQNIGAGKRERVRAGFLAGVAEVFVLSVPFIVCYVIFPEALLKFFISEPSAEALRSGMLFLRIIAPFYMIASLKLISDGVLRGAGLMNRFMAATFTDLTLRVVLAFILSGTSLGYVGIWCAWPVGWTISTIMSVLLCRKAFKN